MSLHTDLQAPDDPTVHLQTHVDDEAFGRAMDAACDRIAPTWPLDQFIAVNPYWGWRSAPIADAAARLGALAGTTLTMPRSWFRDERRAGRLADRHLVDAAAELGAPELADVALSVARRCRRAVATTARAVRAGDRPPRPGTRAGTRPHVDRPGGAPDQPAVRGPLRRVAGLVDARSRAPVCSVRGARIPPSPTGSVGITGAPGHAPGSTPCRPTPPEAIARMLDELGVAPAGREAYLTALLCSVNGWAAWCAYQRWQARLAGTDDDSIVDLLAIRLAWEWLLAHDHLESDGASERLQEWAASWTLLDEVAAESADDQRLDWVLQTAVERTWQDSLIAGLPAAARPEGFPAVQAAFCIDVRSEVFRRAVESTDPTVRTRGFAGFFGLPIAYTPAGSALTRPQLPGLLAPALEVTDLPSADDASSDHDPSALAASRIDRLQTRERRQAFRKDPSSMFTYVESMGLLSGMKLVKESLPHHHAPAAWEHDGLDADHGSLRPRLALVDDDPAAAAAIGHRVLTCDGVGVGIRSAGAVVRPRQHEREQPARGGSRLRCVRWPDRRGQRTRARRPAQHPGGAQRDVGARHRRARHDVVRARAPRHHHRRRAAVRHRRRADVARVARLEHLGRLLQTAGETARAERAASLGLDPAIGTGGIGTRRSTSGPTTGRRCVPSGASPATRRSSSRHAGARAISTWAVACSCTTTTGDSTRSARCSR